MTTTYIRDLATGKASPVSNEEEFKKQYPSGRYLYFEVEGEEPDHGMQKKKEGKKEKKVRFDEEEDA